MAFVYSYFKFIKAEETYIGGFNFLDEEITIETESKSLKVKSQEMFKLAIKKRGEIEVAITDSTGKSVRSNKYLVGQKKGIIMEYVSERDLRECIVKSNVSNVYYKIDEENFINEFEILKNRATESFYYELESGTDTFVYPGFYEKELLPTKLEKDSKVIGLFFVKCENLSDESKMTSDMLGSIYFESE